MSECIADEINLLEQKLVEFLLTSNKPINDILGHIFATGGKRIRPTIFLLCAQLIGYKGEHKFPIAAVCEYIHTASLLHDDVIDNSTLRRNKPTVNSIWGDETAVLAGDLVYSTACRLMVKTKNLELIDTFAECIRFMSECELYQLEMLWNSDIQEAEYDRLISGKTAILFEASAKTPGFLHSSSPEVVALLSDFGKNLGMAFQIADDCLDYTASQETAGKPISADILEGKITLPLIYALQTKNAELNDIVHKIVESGFAEEKEKHRLKELISETNGIGLARSRAQRHISRAIESIEKVAEIHNQESYLHHPVVSLKKIAQLIIN